jgi:hypothetical protein
MRPTTGAAASDHSVEVYNITRNIPRGADRRLPHKLQISRQADGATTNFGKPVPPTNWPRGRFPMRQPAKCEHQNWPTSASIAAGLHGVAAKVWIRLFQVVGNPGCQAHSLFGFRARANPGVRFDLPVSLRSASVSAWPWGAILPISPLYRSNTAPASLLRGSGRALPVSVNAQ